jgi:hypothetical protein
VVGFEETPPAQLAAIRQLTGNDDDDEAFGLGGAADGACSKRGATR